MPDADVRGFLRSAEINPEIGEALKKYHDTLKTEPLFEAARKFGYHFTLDEFLKVRDAERRANLHMHQLAVEGQTTSPYTDGTEAVPVGEGLAPFRLSMIIINGLRMGGLAGAMLTSENWNRLGHPYQARVARGLGILATVVGGILLGVAYVYPLLLTVLVIGWLAMPFGLVWWQKSAYDEWVAAHDGCKPTRHDWDKKSFRFLIGLSYFFTLVGGGGVALLSEYAIEEFGPRQVYAGHGIRVEYPKDFEPYQFAPGNCDYSDCLVAAGTPDHMFYFGIVRAVVYDPAHGRFGVAYNDERFQGALMETYTRAQISSRKEITIDGHNALRAEFSYRWGVDAEWAWWTQIIIEDGDAIYELSFVVDQMEDGSNYDSDIEDIIESITFED